MAVNVTTVCCFHILSGHFYHQIPSKHPRSQAEVLGRIFPGIFLRMPLIYESCWQLGDISFCLSSQFPLLPLPRLPTSPRNVTLYKAVCLLFIVGHRGDTVTFIYPVPYSDRQGDKGSRRWLLETDFKLCVCVHAWVCFPWAGCDHVDLWPCLHVKFLRIFFSLLSQINEKTAFSSFI